ncbi:MAG: hypothetical protein H8E73_00110, partial [Planctomycetes bacterium]|nr:hypothetical protein [Planctomycetota bacterium]
MDISIVTRVLVMLSASFVLTPAYVIGAGSSAASDGAPLKKVVTAGDAGESMLNRGNWRPWQKGFERTNGNFICDNASDAQVQRGLSQTVALNQTRPEPIVAAAWSKADGVGGSRGSDYSLYLDLVYSDGTPLWGQVAPFNVGTHDWEKAQVIVFPEKPVRSVSFHMLMRRHPGKASFRDPELRVLRPPAGACLFDGIPVSPMAPAKEGFQVRDVAADSDFVRFERRALGLELKCRREQVGSATFFDVTISDTTGKDRAVTLVYAIAIPTGKCRWLENPRRSMAVEAGQEYVNAGRFSAGANGRLSRLPFAALASDDRGVGLGIDMARPAFFRVGYNAGTKEKER